MLWTQSLRRDRTKRDSVRKETKIVFCAARDLCFLGTTPHFRPPLATTNYPLPCALCGGVGLRAFIFSCTKIVFGRQHNLPLCPMKRAVCGWTTMPFDMPHKGTQFLWLPQFKIVSDCHHPKRHKWWHWPLCVEAHNDRMPRVPVHVQGRDPAGFLLCGFQILHPSILTVKKSPPSRSVTELQSTRCPSSHKMPYMRASNIVHFPITKQLYHGAEPPLKTVLPWRNLSRNTN